MPVLLVRSTDRRRLARLWATFVLALAAPAAGLRAQDRDSLPEPARELRVFLDCQTRCDADYVRTEIPWVEFVRDRMVADVHVLLTGLGTGAGGQEVTVALLGQGSFRARVDTLTFVSQPGQPPDLVRQGLTRTIQLGLVPFVARTPGAGRLRISAQALAGDAAGSGVPVDDPWNAWVMSVGMSGSLEAESRQQQAQLGVSANARRVTNHWKLGVAGSLRLEQERFELEDRTATNAQERYSGGAVAVRSLGAHWSAGAQLSVNSSTFQNLDLLVRAAPAVEYSVWPYEEATRRQLVFQYSVGVSSFDYREVTVFDRLAETRPSQAFVVGYDVEQPWGTADAELEAANFLDDVSKFRVELDGGVDLRLVRGLELRIGGSASLIRDQLAIVRRGQTPEDILLQRRALQTDHRYELFVGISYTFGSIFNSVVNPRFGTGPGAILR